MKKRILAGLMAAALVVVSATACNNNNGGGASDANQGGGEQQQEASGGDAAAAGGDYSVILVTMDGLDNHWVNVDKGAQQAAEDYGVKYEWIAPDKKDTQLQIEALNNAIEKKPDVLLVAAVDPDAIVDTLQKAEDAGIIVIYTDCVANFEGAAAFRTNGFAGGAKAGEAEIEALEALGITDGKIGVVSFSNATQNALDRTNGFISAFDGTDFEILEVQYGDSEVAASQAAAENFISQGCVGIYGDNEPGAVGVGNAVAANPNWEGIAVGFDASSVTLDHVQNGNLYCVMAQKPYMMGYMALEAGVTLLEGGELDETDVDTGSDVVTADVVDEYR